MNRLFDRKKMTYFPLATRKNKVSIKDACVDPYDQSIVIDSSLQERTDLIAKQILDARNVGASVMCAFGAHTIKNGMGRLLGMMVEKGWLTHLATNGAAVIHDWEFAFQGFSSEDVKANVIEGKFGTWEETGLYLNLALAIGAFEGLGYGQSIGAMIHNNGLSIPTRADLLSTSKDEDVPASKRAAALDLLEVLDVLDLPQGFVPIEHPFASYSVQEKCYVQQIPCTSHPMFGHDIIYTHKANHGAAIGRVAERDFLTFVENLSHLEHGVYLSVGSAVMSPMIFEKSLSMVRNSGVAVNNCAIHVVDLQRESWDWSKGEPPVDNPAYYLRFMKTFSRMGCHADYMSADNKAFFVSLYRSLEERS